MRILIISSSRDEVNEKYLELGNIVGNKLRDLNLELNFGAASTGIMGRYKNYFRTVNSYTVKKYVNDLRNINSTKEYILDTTFDRTKNLYQDSDLILVLPGGTGTLAEIFGILEENRSIDNPKPMYIYNYDHFYDNVINIIETCINNKFNDKSIYNYFYVSDNLDQLIDKIKEHL